MPNAKLSAILLVTIASGYPVYISYAYLTRPPTQAEIQESIDATNDKIISRCNNTATRDATGATTRAIELDSNRLRNICLQDLVWDLPITAETQDQKQVETAITHEAKVSTTGSVIPVPPKTWSKGDKVIREDYRKTPTADTCSFPISKVKMVVIHYTAWDGNAENVERTHTNKYQDKDWSAIHTYPSSYHYLIEKDGSIIRPRSETCWSLALLNTATMRNDETINISYIGTWKPTAKQIDSLVSLTRNIQDRYLLSRDSVTAHADIQSKNKAESMKWMFGSKAEFIKLMRKLDKITIYGKSSPELIYAYLAWWDKDFIGTIFQESRMSNKANGDGGQSIGYCQIHKWYQPWWYTEYSKLTTMKARLNYCHEKYIYASTLPGGIWSRFHGYNARSKHIQNITIQ